MQRLQTSEAREPSLPLKELRERAKSARDFFVRDHPNIGREARAEAYANGDTLSHKAIAVNHAYSAAIAEMKTQDPERWEAYERESQQSKTEMRAAHAVHMDDQPPNEPGLSNHRSQGDASGEAAASHAE